MAQPKRFDHWFRQFEQEGELLQRHIQKSVKEMRLAKATAYRMAQAFITMQKHHHNELLDMINSMSMTVDEWVAQWFQPLTAIGESWPDLVRAIQEGMTPKEYEKQTPSVFVKNKRGTRSVAGGTPREPDGELTPEEALKQWRARAKALEVRLREEQQKRRALEQEVIRLNKLVKKIRNTLKINV